MHIYRVIIFFIVSFVMVTGVHANDMKIVKEYDSDQQGIVFSADFNEGSDVIKMGFHYSGNENAKIVQEKFLGDSPALKISLQRFTDEVSYRSEVVPEYKKDTTLIIGNEHWYAFRVFIPADWKYDEGVEAIAQWHGYPDADLGETWRNGVPLVLRIGGGSPKNGNNFLINVRSDSRKVTPIEKPWRGGYYKSNLYDLGPIESDMGKWTQWVFHVKWSYKDDGFIKVWKDGKKIINFENMSNCFNDENGPYMKFGVYKWLWKDPEFSVDVVKRVLYFDDVKIANGKATYDDLLPDGINQPGKKPNLK